MEPLYLVWGRSVDLFKSLDEALDQSWWASESDDDWFDYIEVVGDGESDRMDREHPTVAAHHRRKLDESMDRYYKQAAARPFIGNITIDDKPLVSLYGDDSPDARLAELRPRLGDRVQFKPARRPVRR
jgi:hypothetical protein